MVGNPIPYAERTDDPLPAHCTGRSRHARSHTWRRRVARQPPRRHHHIRATSQRRRALDHRAAGAGRGPALSAQRRVRPRGHPDDAAPTMCRRVRRPSGRVHHERHRGHHLRCPPDAHRVRHLFRSEPRRQPALGARRGAASDDRALAPSHPPPGRRDHDRQSGAVLLRRHRDLSSLDHLSVLHQMVDQRHVTIHELVAIADGLCHPARRGSTRFRESLVRLGSGAVAQSHGEVRLAEALRERGVPVECQSKVDRGKRGKRAHVDLAVPRVRWGVELDIHPEHRSLEGHGGDRSGTGISTSSTGRSSPSAKRTWPTSNRWLTSSPICTTLADVRCRPDRLRDVRVSRAGFPARDTRSARITRMGTRWGQ